VCPIPALRVVPAMGKGKISTPASRPGAAGPGKKLGSLNSVCLLIILDLTSFFSADRSMFQFQAILKFNQSPAFILNTVGPARTSRPSAEQDSKLMPPPPPGVRPKARSNGSASASTSPVPSSSSTTKAKVVINGDVVEILSSDEEVEKSTVEFRQGMLSTSLLGTQLTQCVSCWGDVDGFLCPNRRGRPFQSTSVQL